jgi:hypothetical protein
MGRAVGATAQASRRASTLQVMVASFVHHLWTNSLAGAAVVALLLGVWGSARSLGLLNRPKYWVRATYLPPHDLVGFTTTPHFTVEYENRGNVPIVFSDFWLALPRLRDVVIEDGTFRFHTGAVLIVDGDERSRLGRNQAYSKLEYLTQTVRLGPGDMHTDFFPLTAFLPPPGLKGEITVPEDFSPVLMFHDSYGKWCYCDEEGVHAGRYEYPHRAALEAASSPAQPSQGLLTQRRRLRFLGWEQSPAHGLGEPE